jgi:uncharacterized membrane protein YdjX (TVP38/TMEM64 family)
MTEHYATIEGVALLQTRTTWLGGRLEANRWLVIAGLAIIAAAAALSYYHLSWRTIGLNYEALGEFVATHGGLAVLAFVALHIAAVALALPFGGMLAVAGGMFFGWATSALASLAGAALGAIAVFLVARGTLGHVLANRSGVRLRQMRSGFERNGVSYVIISRLVGVPAFVITMAAALFGMRLKPFALGTVLGAALPLAAIAYLGSTIGVGISAQNDSFRRCLAAHPLDADAACPYAIDWSAFPGWELFIAATALVFIALIPVAIKRRSTRHVAV